MPTLKRKDADERGRLSKRIAAQTGKRKPQKDPVVQDVGEDPWGQDPWAVAEFQSDDLSFSDPWALMEGAGDPPDPWLLAERPGEPLAIPRRIIELGHAVAATAASTLSQGLQADRSKYLLRGCVAARVAGVCGKTCHRNCRHKGCQRHGLDVSVAISFVNNFWSLPEDHRGHCLRTAYYSGELGWDRADVQWSRVQAQKKNWSVADVPVCFARLCSVLGTGQRTVRKMIAGAPDGRKKLLGVPAPAKPAEQMAKCNTFFTELHQSAAVPDPEDEYCAGQDDSSPWENWDYDWGSVSPVTVACQGRVLGLPRRYIGHCRLLDLYWQMSSEWSVVQELRPEVGAMPCFTTFAKCYKERWKKMLVIRKESQHGRCQLCSDCHRVMRKSNLSWSDRTTAAQRLRQHLRDQYTDRMLYWSMRWSSRQVVQPEVICIIIDSMGKWGSAWPKFHHDKIPHELERIARPTMILTAALAHGWCTGLFLSLEPYGHGSVSKLEDRNCFVLHLLVLSIIVNILFMHLVTHFLPLS